MKNRRLQEILKEFPDDFDIRVILDTNLDVSGDLDIKDVKEETDKVILFVDESPVST